MTKIIIQTGKYRGLYQIILLKKQRFFIIKWWKAVKIAEYFEDDAVVKLCELIRKYKLKPCDIYDWSSDEYYQKAIDKAIKLS